MISSMLKRAIVVQDEGAADEELRSWHKLGGSLTGNCVRGAWSALFGVKIGRFCQRYAFGAHFVGPKRKFPPLPL